EARQRHRDALLLASWHFRCWHPRVDRLPLCGVSCAAVLSRLLYCAHSLVLPLLVPSITAFATAQSVICGILTSQEAQGVTVGPSDKAEVRERPKKPPGYRKFAKLLKQVVKAPPMPEREGA